MAVTNTDDHLRNHAFISAKFDTTRFQFDGENKNHSCPLLYSF